MAAKIRTVCTCHGFTWGSGRDLRVHRGRVSYEPRVRVGNRWMNRKQVAARERRRGR